MTRWNLNLSADALGEETGQRRPVRIADDIRTIWVDRPWDGRPAGRMIEVSTESLREVRPEVGWKDAVCHVAGPLPLGCGDRVGGVWLETAVVLKGGGTFVDMIPFLTIGTGWFMAVIPGQLAHSTDSDCTSRLSP